MNNQHLLGSHDIEIRDALFAEARRLEDAAYGNPATGDEPPHFTASTREFLQSRARALRELGRLVESAKDDIATALDAAENARIDAEGAF